MKILGIDQSLTSTGWVIIEDNVVTHYGIISSSTKDNKFDRVKYISKEITELIEKYNVDFIGIEGLPFMARSNVTRDLAGLQFVIVTNLKRFELDKNVFVLPPTSIKKFATGTGKADKEEMYKALPIEIQSRFKTTPKSRGRFDITDAYWIAKLTEEKISEST